MKKKKTITVFIMAIVMVAVMALGAGKADAYTYYNYFEKPDNNAVYKVNDSVEISIWAGAVRTRTNFDAYGNPGKTTYLTMPAKVKALKGTEVVFTKDFTYEEPTRLETSFTPKEAGTYTIELYGYAPSVNSTDEVLHDKREIKVEKGAVVSAVTSPAKIANPLKVKAKTAKVKYSKLKKKNQTLAVNKVMTFAKKGQGKLTYNKASGNKKITINKNTGKVTVKKKLKKGTYKVKVKVKASGNSKYMPVTRNVTFKIKVK